MDVEGAEWGIFDTTSVDLLCRFEQITFETARNTRPVMKNQRGGARSYLRTVADFRIEIMRARKKSEAPADGSSVARGF
jgi:hypothetical protein